MSLINNQEKSEKSYIKKLIEKISDKRVKKNGPHVFRLPLFFLVLKSRLEKVKYSWESSTGIILEEENWSRAKTRIIFSEDELVFFLGKHYWRAALKVIGRKRLRVHFGTPQRNVTRLGVSYAMFRALAKYTAEIPAKTKKDWRAHQKKQLKKRIRRDYSEEKKLYKRIGIDIPPLSELRQVIRDQYRRKRQKLEEGGKSIMPFRKFLHYRINELRRLSRPLYDQVTVDWEGRQHSPITNTSKVWRTYLTFDGEHIDWVDFDLKAAHATLLPSLMKREEEKPFLQIVMERGEDIYEYMVKESLGYAISPPLTRDRAKILFQRTINRPLRQRKPDQELLLMEMEFPSLDDYLCRMKKAGGYKVVGSLLRSEEARIFHLKIAPALLKAGLSRWIIIHDGIIISEDDKEETIRVINRVILEEIGPWAEMTMKDLQKRK